MKITTPTTKAVIELRDWISGGQSEYINAPLLAAVQVAGGAAGSTPSLGKIDLSATVEMKHRLLESFVISIDDSKENILARLLALPEDDYDFVNGEIEGVRKKK